MSSKFTVAMSVYKNDNAENFKLAIKSIYFGQTVRPSEIILIEDGPLTKELQDAVNEVLRDIPILVLYAFPVNRGHAAARQSGLEHSSNEIIAIMDSDDIAEPNRFEIQMQLLKSHPDASVIGGLINEFIHDPKNIVGTRAVPELDIDIKKYLKKRCPMNLQTVIYRKSKIMEVGGFKDWYCEEDYYLWIRLAMAGHTFYNYQGNLVNVRVGNEMYKRRGGWKYFASEARLQLYMFNNHIINIIELLKNITVRLLVQVLMPNTIRGWVFQKFARK